MIDYDYYFLAVIVKRLFVSRSPCVRRMHHNNQGERHSVVCVKKRDGRRRRPLSLTTQVAVRNALLGTAQSFTAVYRVIGYEPIRFLPSY
jgi:hypothetical protein